MELRREGARMVDPTNLDKIDLTMRTPIGPDFLAAFIQDPQLPATYAYRKLIVGEPTSMMVSLPLFYAGDVGILNTGMLDSKRIQRDALEEEVNALIEAERLTGEDPRIAMIQAAVGIAEHRGLSHRSLAEIAILTGLKYLNLRSECPTR